MKLRASWHVSVASEIPQAVDGRLCGRKVCCRVLEAVVGLCEQAHQQQHSSSRRIVRGIAHAKYSTCTTVEELGREVVCQPLNACLSKEWTFCGYAGQVEQFNIRDIAESLQSALDLGRNSFVFCYQESILTLAIADSYRRDTQGAY